MSLKESPGTLAGHAFMGGVVISSKFRKTPGLLSVASVPLSRTKRFLPHIPDSLRPTWCFFGGVEPLVGSGYGMSIAQGIGNVTLHVFCWYCDGWTNFWPLPKFTNSHMLCSRDFHPWKETFDSAVSSSKWPDQKFRKEVFWTLHR